MLRYRTSRKMMSGHSFFVFSHLTKSNWRSSRTPSSSSSKANGMQSLLVVNGLTRKEKRTNSGARTHSTSWTSRSQRIWRSSWKRRQVRRQRVYQLVWRSLKHSVRRLHQRRKSFMELKEATKCYRVYLWMEWLMLSLFEWTWSKNVAKTSQNSNLPSSWTWNVSCRSWKESGTLSQVTRAMKWQHCTLFINQLKGPSS